MQRKENLKMSSCVSQCTQSYAVKLPLDTLGIDHTALHNTRLEKWVLADIP